MSAEFSIGGKEIGSFTIEPLTTKRVKYLIPKEDLQNGYITLLIRRIEPAGVSLEGKFIFHSLLVIGVK
jgi:hypothetical protein